MRAASLLVVTLLALLAGGRAADAKGGPAPKEVHAAIGRAADWLKARHAKGFKANPAGTVFLDFFQVDKNTGNAKGIIALDL